MKTHEEKIDKYRREAWDYIRQITDDPKRIQGHLNTFLISKIVELEDKIQEINKRNIKRGKTFHKIRRRR